MDTLATQTLRAFSLIFAAALSVPTALAQQADTSKWKCEYCPFESGYRADYELGATSVSDDSAYFGDASGYDDSGAYANIDGEGTYTDENQQLSWTLEDVGLDSRFVELNGGNQGRYDYRVAYREIPQRKFFTTRSVFRQSGPANLSLPGGWVRAPLTTGFTELGTSLVGQDIESDRSLLEVGGRYLQSKDLTFSADFRRHERDGIDVVGGSFFFQSSLLPKPFDYVTDEVELGVRYALDAGYVAVGWRMSEFENDYSAFSWENPFTSGTGADIGTLSQAPDNEFQQLSLSGAYQFDKFQTVLGFSAAMGEMEQNDAFLPYTSNTSLSPGSLPRSSLNGSVDTNNVALSLKSRITDDATIKITYRYDERDNNTPQDIWTRVITDNFISAESETNTPYGYERSTFSISGDYDLLDSVKVSAGYDRKEMDRDFQEVDEQTEDAGWGRVRWRPNSMFDIEYRGGMSERDVDFYDKAVAASLDQNPRLRKYNLAYRLRGFSELTATVTPPDSPLSFTITGMYAEDEYDNSRVGLTDGEDLRVTTDLGWTVSEKVSAYATGSYEKITSDQTGSEQFDLPDWYANNDDTFYTIGGGIRIREIADKAELQLDYVRSDGTSEIKMTSASGGFSQFPDLNSTLDYLRLKLVYHYSDRVDFTTRLRYQSFSADDWALQGVGPATIPEVLTLGAQPYDDDVFIVGIGFRYRIGGSADTAEGE